MAREDRGRQRKTEEDECTETVRSCCWFPPLPVLVLIYTSSFVSRPVNHQKDYRRAENKFQSISKLFIPQVIIPRVSFFSQTTTQIICTFISERKDRKAIKRVSGPIPIPRTLNTGT